MQLEEISPHPVTGRGVFPCSGEFLWKHRAAPGPFTWGQAGNPCLDGKTAGPGTRGDLFPLDPMECCRLEENHAPDAASGFRKLLDFQVIQSSSTEEKILAQRGNVAAQRAPGSTKPLETLMRGILGLFPK